MGHRTQLVGNRVIQLVLTAMFVLVPVVGIHAATPSTIKLEAKITDPLVGAPNGNYPVRFRIYANASSTSNPLWEENFPDVQFVNGVFNETLGVSTPFTETVFNQSDLIFGVEINNGSEVYLPARAVPVAIKSKWSDSVGNFNWASVNVTNTPNVSAFGGTILDVQIPNSLVTSRMVQAGAIYDSHISGPISVSKLSGSISSLNIGAGSISGVSIEDGAITNSKLNSGVFS
ncbi:hypothetical protein EB093_07425, partial [bacterium]|nr:hypothetical protein [bacterium]